MSLLPVIIAPEVTILAAWPRYDTKEAVFGQEPTFLNIYNILSTTYHVLPCLFGFAADCQDEKSFLDPPSAISSAKRNVIHLLDFGYIDSCQTEMWYGPYQTPYIVRD